jgi:hypothetical protein
MGINAVIVAVQEHDDGLKIVLGPRTDRDGHKSTPGQNAMIIESPTWTPPVGMTIWGDAENVYFGPREYMYQRHGYTRLREKFGLHRPPTRE